MLEDFPIKNLVTLHICSNFAASNEKVWRCIFLLIAIVVMRMKKSFIALVLGVLFTMPCVLRAEEIYEKGI